MGKKQTVNSGILKLAFRINIDPLNTAQHAAKAETLIKVLKNITESYNNFIEAELSKNPEYKKTKENNDSHLNKIREEMTLLVVDLNFGSAEIALAPALSKKNEMFDNPADKWEKNTFRRYKKDVMFSDYSDPKFIKKVVKRYSDEQRKGIYSPVIASIDENGEYRLNIKKTKRKIVRTFWKPDENIMHILAPKKKPQPNHQYLKTMNIVAQVAETPNAYNLPISAIKKVLSFEELHIDTSPYRTDVLIYEERVFVLNRKLDNQVTHEVDNFIIRNDEFDITVWGQTREKAEEAFAFTFDALYTNYALEKDENLSDKAIELKNKLKSIIKKIR